MKLSGEIKALTGLRGVAACWVMVGHFRHHLAPAAGLTNRIIDHKGLAVDLFLMLSGFVLGRAYGQTEGCTNRWPGYWIFIRNRLARIYPLYFLTTLLCFIFLRLNWLQSGDDSASFRALIQNLLMVQAWGFFQTGSSNLPGWSISTEWAANVGFLIIAAVTLRGSRSLAAIVMLSCFAVLAWIAFAVGGEFQGLLTRGNLQASAPASHFAVIRCLAEFAMGMITWRVSFYHQIVHRLSSNHVMIVVCLFIFALLPLPNADLLIVALFVPFLLGLTGENVIARVLRSPVPYWLGVISFSIYLVHVPAEPLIGLVINFMVAHHAPLPAVSNNLVKYLMPLALSALTYRVIELPFKKAFSAPHRRMDVSAPELALRG